MHGWEGNSREMKTAARMIHDSLAPVRLNAIDRDLSFRHFPAENEEISRSKQNNLSTSDIYKKRNPSTKQKTERDTYRNIK